MDENYSLRPVMLADYEFIYDLNRRAMRTYVEPLWGWDEALQREAFRQRFRLENHWLILVGKMAAGHIQRESSPDREFIAQISLLPEYQGRGIGSAVVRAIQAEAAPAGKLVELRVLRTNPDARRLYERLGFVVFDSNETHEWMRWTPGG
ncbi:MAG: GNAT family N-acetyltransferase [Anaerolineae bacterium]|nr:GNAT family N-acetyltransferase [Anaerolineae bacterium]